MTNTLNLARIYLAEWANYRAMVNEATAKGRDDEMPEVPTYGSALDSWDQAPDDVRAEWMPGVDGDAVAAALAERDPDDELPAV